MLDIIVEIAKILAKEEVPNWEFNLMNTVLRGKYIKQAMQICDKLMEAGWKRQPQS